MNGKKKIFYATSNDGKIYNLKRIVRNIPVEIVGPKDFNISVDVCEDGKNVVENAIKKAQAYYEILNMPTLAADTAMYISALSKEEQPGMNVRRVEEGRELSKDEMIEYYRDVVRRCGGSSLAWNVTGIALITSDGVDTLEIKEDEVILTSERDYEHDYKVSPLDVITIDPIRNMYYSEMTDEEIMSAGYKFDVAISDFLSKNFLE